MAVVDDYLRGQITPQLVAGEQILGFGVIRRPLAFNALGVPSGYEEWLATATNLRLILFLTEGHAFDILTVRPKPMCKQVVQWWYQELETVTLGTVTGIGSGVILGLSPYKPLGPYQGEGRRYDIFPSAGDLDGHGSFYSEYRGWLQRQVAAGSFPLDAERQGRIAAFKEQERLEAERKAIAAAERKRQMDAVWSKFKPYAPQTVLAIVGLGVAAIGLILAVDGGGGFFRHREALERAEAIVKLAEGDVAWRKAGTDPPLDCPEKKQGLRSGWCHGCIVYDKRPNDSYGYKLLIRGTEFWFCPPVSSYEEELVKSRSFLEREKERSSYIGQLIGGIVGLLFGLVILAGGAVWALLTASKRKKVASNALAP